MSEHATLAPSDWKGWTKCPGKPQALASLPSQERQTSDDADWGTAVHEIGAGCLDDVVAPSTYIGQVVPVKRDGQADFLHTVTAEDVHNVDVYVNYVNLRMREYGPGTELLIEERMECGQNFHLLDAQGEPVPSPLDSCWGTADAVLFAGDRSYVEVVDYKNGQYHVDETGCGQTLLYLMGALKRCDPLHPYQRARLTIVQPRSRNVQNGTAEAVRTWELDMADLMQWVVWLGTSGHVAMTPDAPRIPGEDQCRFCDFKAHCPELATQLGTSVESLATSLDPDSNGNGAAGPVVLPDEEDPTLPTLSPKVLDLLTSETDLDAHQIALVLDMEPLLKTWLKAVHKRGQRMMLTGQQVPGYKVVNGQRRRDWNVDEETLLKKMANFSRVGDDGKAEGKLRKATYTVLKPVSPAVAERTLKPMMTPQGWKSMEALYTWEEGAPTVVPESDSRPAINAPTAQEQFALTQDTAATESDFESML